MSDLQARTKRFTLDIIRFCRTLPRNSEGRIIGRQLLRSGASVGANYRAACHAQSRAAFIAKLSIVEEEADEAQFWLELLDALGTGAATERRRLLDEAHQLASIAVASKKTARRNRSR
jgi:four helix bundle protein